MSDSTDILALPRRCASDLNAVLDFRDAVSRRVPPQVAICVNLRPAVAPRPVREES